MGVKALPQVSESAHQDANQNYTALGVQGTLGTSDVAGTAPTVSFSGDPTTGAQYVYNLGPAGSVTLGNIPGGTLGSILGIGGTVQVSGASAGTNVNIVTGTQQTLGTVGTVLGVGGVVQVNQATGTINTGTFNAGTTYGANLESIGSATGANSDIIASFDASAYKWFTLQLLNTWVGTVTVQYSNDNVAFTNAPIQTLTSTASNVSATLTGNNMYYGPILGRYMKVRMNAYTSGTAQAILETSTNPGFLNTFGVVAAQSGAWNVTVNSITASGGTILNLANGTVSQNFIPIVTQSTFGTHGTTGATVFGTLAGGTSSGAGTEIFITSLSLTIPSTGGSQDVSIGWGTNAGTFHAGTGQLVRGNFPAGGGIQKQFNPAINSGTNAQLTLFQAGAGTVDVAVTTFTTASTV